MSTNTMQVVDVQTAGKPIAIVLLFGWMGASIRHVEKYATLYNQRGCCTITGVADKNAIMRYNSNNDKDDDEDCTVLDEFVLEAVAHAIKLMHGETTTTTIPIIVHVFSNGGAFVLERLECMVASASPSSDVATVGRSMKLGAQVFDSAPAYLYVRAGLKAVATASPDLLIRWVLQVFFLLHITYETVRSMILRRPTRPTRFWNHMKDSTATKRQVYVFSTADELTDAMKLRELVRYRCKKGGIEVQSLEFPDSKHVQHLRSHPHEYMDMIDMLLKSIATKSE